MARATSVSYLDYGEYSGYSAGRRRRKHRRRGRLLRGLFLLALSLLLAGALWWQGLPKGENVAPPPRQESRIAQIAAGELGADWQKTCQWWGLAQRDEWCAMFVCWASDLAGYRADEDYIKSFGLNSDIGYPNDSGASSSAHARFHDKQGRYRARVSGYRPASGDYIYFNWAGDESGGPLNMDHIGLVERVEKGKVYTLEGNSQLGDDSPDLVRRKCYALTDTCIRGYSDMSGLTQPADEG